MRFFTEQEKRNIDAMYHGGEKIDDIRSHLHGICLDRKKRLSDQFFQMLNKKVA